MLLDTNIIVEIGRNQSNSDECQDLLSAIQQGLIKEDVYITQFALHAIEALVANVNSEFMKAILLTIHQGYIQVYKHEVDDDLLALSGKDHCKLDLDDATQFFAANRLGTYIVTYDKDFKETGIKTKMPKEILSKILLGNA